MNHYRMRLAGNSMGIAAFSVATIIAVSRGNILATFIGVTATAVALVAAWEVRCHEEQAHRREDHAKAEARQLRNGTTTRYFL